MGTADALGLRLEAITVRLEGLRAASASQSSAVGGALREQANSIDRLTEEMARVAERQRVAGADLTEQISVFDGRLSKVTLSLFDNPRLLEDLSDAISQALTQRIGEQLVQRVGERLGRGDAEHRQLLSAVRDSTTAANRVAEEAGAATLAARQLARVAVDGLNGFGEGVLDALEERYGVQLDQDGGSVAHAAFPRLADGVAALTAEVRDLGDEVAGLVDADAGASAAPMADVIDAVATLTAELRQVHGDVSELAEAQANSAEKANAAVTDSVATFTTELRQLHDDMAGVVDAQAAMSEAAVAAVADNVATLTAELRQLHDDVAELAESQAGTAGPSDLEPALAALQAELVAIKRRLPVRARETRAILDPDQFDPLVDAIIARLVSIADVVQAPDPTAGPGPGAPVNGAAGAAPRRSGRSGS